MDSFAICFDCFCGGVIGVGGNINCEVNIVKGCLPEMPSVCSWEGKFVAGVGG